MNKYLRIGFIVLIYYFLIICSSCCRDDKANFTGEISGVILTDYTSVPEAINNDTIKTGFRLAYFPIVELVHVDFNLVHGLYALSCEYEIIDKIKEETLQLSFDKNLILSGTNIPANTNLLDLPEFDTVEINTECNFFLCEFNFSFPDELIQKMSIEKGELNIRLQAETNEGLSFDHPFKTIIDLL